MPLRWYHSLEATFEHRAVDGALIMGEGEGGEGGIILIRGADSSSFTWRVPIIEWDKKHLLLMVHVD